jgi:hypothetical protein
VMAAECSFYRGEEEVEGRGGGRRPHVDRGRGFDPDQ